jgi:bacilysin biosynthesis protein BacB
LIYQKDLNFAIFNLSNSWKYITKIMSQFFPNYELIKLSSGIELKVFNCQDTIFQFASVEPNAQLEPHQHRESQLGMILNGSLVINLNGNKTLMQPLSHVYVAESNILHGASNLEPKMTEGFDLKRINNYSASETSILKLAPDEDTITNLSCLSVTGDWFKISMIKIPSGCPIPSHQSEQAEIGFILNGELQITIDNQEQCLNQGQIYYAPSQVLHQGNNLSNQEIYLIKILI